MGISPPHSPETSTSIIINQTAAMMLKSSILIVLAVGININLVSGDCCYKVAAWYKVKNNAYDQNTERFGYYYLQPGTVNGRAHYESEDGKYVIWYNWTFGKWFVGWKKNLGKENAFFAVKTDADCPYRPAYTWRYVDQYNNWTDADKGFSIWCKS